MFSQEKPSDQSSQDYSQTNETRRPRRNENVLWFLYGLVPIVTIGTLVLCIIAARFWPPGGGLPEPEQPAAPEFPTTVTVPASSTSTNTPTATATLTGTPTPTGTATPTGTPTFTPTPITAVPVVTTTVAPITEIPFGPTTITPTGSVDPLAVDQAQDLAPRFSESLAIQIEPMRAKGLDAARIGGSPGVLAAMIAPPLTENQKYIHRDRTSRDVMGIFGLNDPRLRVEQIKFVTKAQFEYPLLGPGAYLFTCHPTRPNDCFAVSLDGREVQINPALITETILDPPVSPATVDYEEGSIKKCFKVGKRKICIKVF